MTIAERTFKVTIMHRNRLKLLLGFFCLLASQGSASSPKLRYSRLAGGVELFSLERDVPRPGLLSGLEKLYRVVRGSESEPPFGKSIAFLVGISRYDHIRPQLPFVENDLHDLREFLLHRGGFDRVYQLSNLAKTSGSASGDAQRRMRPSSRPP